MAVLTSDNLAELRRQMAKTNDLVDYNKSTINLALQAIEDWFENNRTNLATAINTVTGAYTFTTAQKKRLIAYWLTQKFIREGVS